MTLQSQIDKLFLTNKQTKEEKTGGNAVCLGICFLGMISEHSYLSSRQQVIKHNRTYKIKIKKYTIYVTTLQYKIGSSCLEVNGLKHPVHRPSEALLSVTTLTFCLSHWPLEFNLKTGWRDECLRKTASKNDSWTVRQKWQAKKGRERENSGYCQKQNSDCTDSALSTIHPFEEVNEQIKSNWITHYRIKLVIGVGLIQRSTNSSFIILDHLPANLLCLSLFVHLFFYSIYLTCKITDSHFNSTHIQTCICIALQVSLFFFFFLVI